MGREDEQAALTGEHAGAEAASAAQRKGAYAAQGDGAPGAAQTETAACCHHKETPRSAQFQADLQRRLNRAIGQLNGVKGMLDDNRYCGDVLTQLAAAKRHPQRVGHAAAGPPGNVRGRADPAWQRRSGGGSRAVGQAVLALTGGRRQATRPPPAGRRGTASSRRAGASRRQVGERGQAPLRREGAA